MSVVERPAMFRSEVYAQCHRSCFLTPPAEWLRANSLHWGFACLLREAVDGKSKSYPDSPREISNTLQALPCAVLLRSPPDTAFSSFYAQCPDP